MRRTPMPPRKKPRHPTSARCWLLGHKFVKADFAGNFYAPGYCLRCGVPAGQPLSEIVAVLAATEPFEDLTVDADYEEMKARANLHEATSRLRRRLRACP